MYEPCLRPLVPPSGAARTSMVTVGALTVPTMTTRWILGNIYWPSAIAFGIGFLPASLLGARMCEVLPMETIRRLFGVLLVGFSSWFLLWTFA